MATSYEFITVLTVERKDRVRCQCKGCHQPIHAAIHMMRRADGIYECWGSDCFDREFGHMPPELRPLPAFPHVNGRRLTEEERQELIAHTERLVARFREEHERILEQERAVARRKEEKEEEKQRRAQEQINEFARQLADRARGRRWRK